MRHTIPFTIEHLKILSTAHGDLHIRTTRTEDLYTIWAEGRDPIRLESRNNHDNFIKELKNRLVHYPNTVTINGEHLQTVPYPDLAHATITSYTTDNCRTYSFSMLSIDPHTDNGAAYNVFAAGVLTSLMGLTQKSYTYHTPGQQPRPHWQRANKVALHPHTIINAEELQALNQEDLAIIQSLPPYRFHDISQGNAYTTIAPHLAAQLAQWHQRAQQQLTNTLLHPNTPAKYEGNIFTHVIAPPHDDLVPYKEGSPLIAHGTPTSLEAAEENRVDYISIAHALYEEDHGLVPVCWSNDQGQTPPHHAVIEDYRITHDPEPDPGDDNPIKKVNAIILELETDQKQSPLTRLSTAFHISGTHWRKSVHIVPERLDHDTLTEAMTYAYWDPDEHNIQGDTEDNFENLSAQMSRLLTAATTDPEKAFIEELEEYANNFRTELPRPPNPLTVTSHNGRVTVTYNPQNA